MTHPPNQFGSYSERIAVLAPVERDAAILCDRLSRAGFDCIAAESMDELSELIHGGAGMAVVAKEALRDEALHQLAETLRAQPSWSDLPLIIMTHSGSATSAIDAILRIIDTTTPTLLERPVRTVTLVSAVRAALQGRRRQYEIRDQLDEQERHNAALLELSQTLERRVHERTARLEMLSQRLRLLAAELTDTEQRERRRLAQLLHDHLQQALVGAKIRATIARRSTGAAFESELDGALEMIDDSLRIARSLTAELRPPVLYEVGLSAALRWLAQRFEEQHDLFVHLNVDDTQPPLPERPRALLFEAIRELLFNVVKYAGVSEAFVTLRRTAHQMHVCVKDQGKGFDVAVIDPSWAAEGQPLIDGGNGGFGLFSVRERLRALGGQFTIDSRPGHGTRIDLFLPLEEVDLPQVADDQAVQPLIERDDSGDEDVAGDRVTRVLLADDHQIVREGIASILDAQPLIEVVGQACDGEEAVRLSRELQPDVIVMDVNMPVMNGIDATREILTRQPRMPIIGLSVQDESGTAAAMCRAGARAYLFKGGDPGDLVRCILTQRADANGSAERANVA